MEKNEAQINFYPMEGEPDIIEFRIDQNGETRFFLHFQPVDEEHARSLFLELVHKLYGLENEKHLKVLLCCSVGMTTTYFAQKLNEVARMLNEDIGFDAVSVNQAYTVGEQYDAVLVAPQVGYMTKRLSEALPDIPAAQINAQIFGSYDAPACISMVKKLIAEARKKKQPQETALPENVNEEKKVLVIAGMPNAREAWVRWRIYDHGKILADREVIKEHFDLQDLTDLIDTCIMMQKNHGAIDAIGIAVQGMIHHGQIELMGRNTLKFGFGRPHINLERKNDEAFNLQEYLQKKYGIPVSLHNNVNAAATGWYSLQSQYRNVVFLSQAAGFVAGGMGIICDGRLIEGSHDSAGELRYLIRHLKETDGIDTPVENPEDMLKVVAAGILTACTVVDPAVVCVRSPMTPDMDEVRNELRKYLPEDHIPDLVYIRNMDEYVLTGEMMLTMQGMKK